MLRCGSVWGECGKVVWGVGKVRGDVGRGMGFWGKVRGDVKGVKKWWESAGRGMGKCVECGGK